jgi:hypothetical protein
MKLKKYYDIKPILKIGADYNMILGRRSNGKSYQVKYVSLYEAYHEVDYITGKPKTRYQLAYGRRWKDELKPNEIESYFDDINIKELTKGEYERVSVYRGTIYFARTDENGKTVRGKQIGKCFALTGATHYKSLTFPLIGNYIFEEFIPETGDYLPRDVENLESIISTIARNEKIRVFLIGNTINAVCPYFRDWELKGAVKQAEGTIDIYNKPIVVFDYAQNKWSESNVKIAVELCRQTTEVGLMAFGKNANSINGNSWDCEIQPHLVKSYDCYINKYRILYKYGEFRFLINLLKDKDTRELTVYVYPYTKDNYTDRRIVTDEYTQDRFSTAYLTALTKYDKIVIELIAQGKICFSDNLTGTEFYQVKKDRGGL